MLDSLQNGRYSFIFTTLLVHTTTPTISTKNPFLSFSQFLPPCSTLPCSQDHPYILTNIHVLSTSLILQLLIVTYNLRNPIYTKSISLLQPLSQFSLRAGTRKLGSLVETDTVLVSIFLLPENMDCHNRAQNHVLLITQGQKIGLLQVVLSGEDACNWMANHLIHYLSYPQPIVISSIPY